MLVTTGLVSRALLLLVALISTVSCLPSTMIPLLESDQPLQKNETTMELSDEALFAAFLRSGLDHSSFYWRVAGQDDDVMDHFIDLQIVKGYLLQFTPSLDYRTLARLVRLVNSYQNVFRIGNKLNQAKSGVSLANYTTNPYTRHYLCSSLADYPNTHIHIYVRQFVLAMTTDPNEHIVAAGNQIANALLLPKSECFPGEM